MTLSADVALNRAEAALAAGDILLAVDIARSVSEPSPRLRFIEVLALARLGDSEAALALHRLLPDQESEDVASLRGRLLKDRALALPAGRAATAFAEASDAYSRAYRATGGYFSGINAATMAALAGRADRARRLATELLADPRVAKPQGYWAAASRVEALALLGQHDDAAEALKAALAMPDAVPAARASTLRQLALIDGTKALVAALRPPPVLVWTGHIFAPDAALEAKLAGPIEAALDKLGSLIGYGPLAGGADLLVAEALLRRGGELNVVLPFAKADFIEQSVEIGWRGRFGTALERAASTTLATETGFVGDPGQFAQGSALALGAARLRADALKTDVAAIALSDGAGSGGVAGTAADIARLRLAEIKPIVIAMKRPPHGTPVVPPLPAPREAVSVIFTDYSGFSKIGEATLPAFCNEIMARIGAVLKDHVEAVRMANSWGDALFAIIRSPAEAAAIALDIAERLAEVDVERAGLPTGSGMRIALHHGPAWRIDDPISGLANYIGSEVTTAARVEPITPVGEVYATSVFAAHLRLADDPRFVAHYVGRVPLHKSFGTLPLYRLARREGQSLG